MGYCMSELDCTDLPCAARIDTLFAWQQLKVAAAAAAEAKQTHRGLA